ncbi:PH domain-containing protein [Demequina sp. NBRC 110051]|uniref:PH domain-containing protein n=1 Tax=Demequina sp. NBRC 110051 TaxID=1570340 RepID=UPI0009FDCB69|nr:PH domain-containing protein [Demequina sp. NBRC 110051]
MGYPRGLLAADEEVVVDRHPHWKALFWPVVVSVLAIAAVIAIAWWVSTTEWSDTTRTWVGVVTGALFAILVGWLAVAPWIRWRTTHFVVTDRRVIYRTGVFTKSGIDIPLQRVNTVQFRHGLIDRLFRTGTLIIESASDDPLEFDDIPDVEKVHALLYNEVFDSLDGDNDPTPGPSAT